MARIEIETEIDAPPDSCFDMARDLDLHRRSLSHTGEEAVAGKTSGLIELGEQVTWRARHFGFVFEHTAKITAFDRPKHFRDEMIQGRFSSFVHDHYFEPVGSGTRMRDVLVFRSPFGPIGAIVDYLVLKGYLRNLLLGRAEVIQAEAVAANRNDEHS